MSRFSLNCTTKVQLTSSGSLDLMVFLSTGVISPQDFEYFELKYDHCCTMDRQTQGDSSRQIFINLPRSLRHGRAVHTSVENVPH